MKTYLVTGGAGFIGSNYIHYMFKKYGDDIRIINVDALTYSIVSSWKLDISATDTVSSSINGASCV